MDGVRFASPYVLLLLLAVPALGVSAWRGRQAPTWRIGALGAAADARRTWRVRGELVLSPLRLLAVALLIVALARPQRGDASSRMSREGIDIVLDFDISSSMTEQFAHGKTRLQAAQDVLSQFITARTNDRVGRAGIVSRVTGGDVVTDALVHNDAADAPITGEQQRALLRTVATPFFDAYLKGDQGARRFLTETLPTLAGIRFKSETVP